MRRRLNCFMLRMLFSNIIVGCQERIKLKILIRIGIRYLPCYQDFLCVWLKNGLHRMSGIYSKF